MVYQRQLDTNTTYIHFIAYLTCLSNMEGLFINSTIIPRAVHVRSYVILVWMFVVAASTGNTHVDIFQSCDNVQGCSDAEDNRVSKQWPAKRSFTMMFISIMSESISIYFFLIMWHIITCVMCVDSKVTNLSRDTDWSRSVSLNTRYIWAHLCENLVQQLIYCGIGTTRCVNPWLCLLYLKPMKEVSVLEYKAVEIWYQRMNVLYVYKVFQCASDICLYLFSTTEICAARSAGPSGSLQPRSIYGHHTTYAIPENYDVVSTDVYMYMKLSNTMHILLFSCCTVQYYNTFSLLNGQRCDVYRSKGSRHPVRAISLRPSNVITYYFMIPCCKEMFVSSPKQKNNDQ